MLQRKHMQTETHENLHSVLILGNSVFSEKNVICDKGRYGYQIISDYWSTVSSICKALHEGSDNGAYIAHDICLLIQKGTHRQKGEQLPMASCFPLHPVGTVPGLGQSRRSCIAVL